MEEKRLVWGHRGGAVRFGFCCALLVFALALTGCRFVQELFGGEEESGPPQPKSAPAPEAEAELTVSAAAFSNAADANSAEVEVSAIDAIRAALSKGVSSVLVQLEAKTDASGAPIAETVKLDDGDISGGLILTHAGDSDTSPAEVIIDGGGRTVDLTGSKQDSLITVGDGVTLTLRNIVFTGLDKTKDPDNDTAANSAALITVASDGHLILEAGAVIRDNAGQKCGGVHIFGMLVMEADAEIRDNSSTLCGGVYVEDSAFTKNGGVIYGYASTDPKSNKVVKEAADGNEVIVEDGGHTAYALSTNDSGKYRNSTAGEDANMTYNVSGQEDAGWDHAETDTE